MADPKRVHVLPTDDGWETRKEGAERASSRHETKAEAVDRGRELAEAAKGQLLVHGKSGKIQEERTYRKDPPETPG